MSTSRFFLPLILIVSILLTSCEKDPYKNGEPSLPPITMEGKNNFGCRINGKIWIPYVKKPNIWTEGIYINLDISSGKRVFRFTMNKKFDDTNETLSFQIINPDIGYNNLNNVKAGLYNFKSVSEHCALFEMVDSSRVVVINKIDYSSRIISGTFEFNKFVNKCNEVIEITDGRFDLKF